MFLQHKIAIPQIQSSNIEAVIQQATLAQDADSIAAATAGAIALGRVYTATSLPSHIWSLNGKFDLFSIPSYRLRVHLIFFFQHLWEIYYHVGRIK